MAKKLHTSLFFLLFLGIARLACAGMIGQSAPEFTLPALAGGQVSLTDLSGKVVFIDFWASWCAPCKKEFPELNRFLRERNDPDLVVLAVNIDKKKAHAQAFLSGLPEKLSDGLHVLLDPASTVIPRYKALAMPTSFIIDRKGVVRYIHYGFNEKDPSKWEAEVSELLREGGQ